MKDRHKKTPERMAYMQEYLKEYRKGYYVKNREKILERQKYKAYIEKLNAINAYGGKCACCGEEVPAFLQIDHINGGGNAERKSMNVGGGWTFYRKLRLLGYPKGYQVLCANCNSAKGTYGVCPHSITEWAEKVEGYPFWLGLTVSEIDKLMEAPSE